MSYSASIKVSALTSLSCLPLVFSCLPVSVRGQQESLEDLYNRAKGYYDQANWDDACDAFQRIPPDFLDARAKREESCHMRDQAYGIEESTFNRAKDFFDRQDYERAKGMFERVLTIKLKNPKHREETEDYLARIKRWEEDEAYNACAAQGNTVEARACFERIVQANGRRAAEARERRNAIAAEIARANAPKPKEAGEQPKVGMAKPAPAVPVTPYEDRLRAGLQAYFAGKLDIAGSQLEDYLRLNGPKKSLAIFFLGATYGTRYLLSGESDAGQRNRALEEFYRLKKLDPRFQPPEAYISPSIQLLYAQAAD